MNNNIIKISRLLILAILIGLCPGIAYGEILKNDSVTLIYEPRADGSIKVIDALNKSSRTIRLWVDNKTIIICAGGSDKPKRVAKKNVRFEYMYAGGATVTGPTLWPPEASTKKGNTANNPEKKNDEAKAPEEKKDDVQVTPKPEEQPKSKNGQEVKTDKKNNDKKSKQTPAAPPVNDVEDVEEHSPADNKGAYSAFNELLEGDLFFGKDAVDEYQERVDHLVEGLHAAEDKAQFLTDNGVRQFLIESETELAEKRKNIQNTAQDMADKAKLTDVTHVYDKLNTRLDRKELAYERLKKEVDSVESEPEGSFVSAIFSKSIINYAIIGIIALIMLILVIIAARRKKSKSKTSRVKTPEQPQPHVDSDNSVIVVRKRTTSILKKQCIDDVKGNPDYMQINASEFTQDSAVRSIYIKNTCIKEVYNMYAEDLRNTGNPKEDGCMVLGRWVYDESTNTYDVTMEATVFPGDDAVFKEYELNFGGKIKLRVAEKLRKLRRDTNLQYDLVCWIHSHPGLGVFFSNSDVNVQMQLKHAQHPNFLIAFVIDILTSTQETGIFTFRHDGTVNSRGDLTKLYSLEEMYKWTLDSERASFSPENYYNILKKSKMQMPSCRGVELNNSSIIDLSQRVLEPVTGLVGRAVGTSFDVNGSKEYVVSGIARADERPSSGVIGLLLNVAHISLPTIQRLIADERGNIAFVMVYSSRQNTVTSIPVINGELIMDEHFYGEETIDDLKIWTRRKR